MTPVPIDDVYVSAVRPTHITAIVTVGRRTFSVRGTTEGWWCQCNSPKSPCRHAEAVIAVIEGGQS